MCECVCLCECVCVSVSVSVSVSVCVCLCECECVYLISGQCSHRLHYSEGGEVLQEGDSLSEA